jgi:phytoene/squalene synthetase
MEMEKNLSMPLAADITRSASKQTYYTIRLFVDRELVNDAYRAYGYFRWVDDIIDEHTTTQVEKVFFVNRQVDLLEACYRGEIPHDLCLEERMLAELVSGDSGENPGLQSYLRNMMAVMKFDADRYGRIISEAELFEYTQALATSVTDAMYYFIGHNDPAPQHEARYLAVTAAHITHMLRDTCADVDAGYFNIPGEYLQKNGISVRDVGSSSYRKWICSRVRLARRYFKGGKEYIAQNKNLRRRLAGYAYAARFEWMLRTIERDNFCLRSDYKKRKSIPAGLWMSWVTLISMFGSRWGNPDSHHLAANSLHLNKP